MQIDTDDMNEFEMVAAIDDLEMHAVTRKRLREHTQMDNEHQQLEQYISAGWPNVKNITEELKCYYPLRQELSRSTVQFETFVSCCVELSGNAKAGAFLIWSPILSTASTTTLASRAMPHPEPHDDFRRFCQVVATAVVDLWSDEEKSKGCVSRTPSLWLPEFVRCQTDFERVTVLMRIPSVRQFTLLPANQSSVCRSSLKSDSKSEELRGLGNYAWQRHQTPQASSFYTKAVLHAASPVKCALAFANRSCVLVRVGVNQAVLDDITHALEKRPRLHVRRGQTLLLMERVDEARSAFLEARDSIQDGSNSSTLNLLITSGLQRCAALALARPIDRPVTSRDTHNSVAYVNHPNHPTHFLKHMAFDQEQPPNRLSTTGGDEAQCVYHLVFEPLSKTDKQDSDLLRIHFSSIERDCYNCLKRSYNLYPCRGCSEIGFCSRACEQAAWTICVDSSSRKQDAVCHRFECGQLARFPNGNFNRWKWCQGSVVERRAGLARYQALFHENSPKTEVIVGPELCRLAFASIAQTPSQAIRSLAQGLSLKLGEDQVDSAVPRRSQSALSAFSGVHEPTLPDLCDADLPSVGWLRTFSEKRDVLNLWQNTIAAVFLTHCLKAGGYKLDWDDNCLLDPSADILLVDEQPLPASWAAACLLHQLQCFPIASQDITRIVYMNDASDPSENAGINWERMGHDGYAKGVYPIMSLRSHSCDMNTHAVYMADGVCALFTSRQIKRDEALSRSIGSNIFMHDRIERQDKLRQYYLIECQCVPCRENWSSHDLSIRIRCPSCRMITPLNTPGLYNLHSGRACSCLRKRLRGFLERCENLCHKAKNMANTILLEFRDIPFHSIPQELMDKQLVGLTRMLSSVGLDGMLVRPSYILVGLQGHLIQLLSLRYGCCVAEPGIHINDPELSSSTCIPQFCLNLENDG
ncbi:hypothetical protein EG68_08071 [Paragonimus skrjabini miyazakii]|uniref:MYND-type domain-containing protein n=1 Tax=Paragonimus skrjabini miyazakii TaxID=59628 RepID=A0A8S9YL88_9TREM|nr:hypothetical protein EG68_08071 [Paragonimus skrjabini miyazakii]